MANAIEVKNVKKCYGDFCAVNSISFEIEEATIFGLIGPNGAGKSTTIRMIMDIIAPDEGEVLIFGEAHQEETIRNNIGYLPEERGLYQKMTVAEHLKFLGELKGMTSSQAKENISFWFDKLKIQDWHDKKIEELSKGMQQKVQFIGAIIHNPNIVILDEPFSGLDPVNMESLKNIVLELKKQGKTILFSTHQMEQAEKLCDHICMINQGNIVINGTLKEIKKQYGKDVIKVNYKGNSEKFKEISEIETYFDFGNYAEIKIKENVDTNELIRNLTEHFSIFGFEFFAPSLHNIFIQVAENDTERKKDI